MKPGRELDALVAEKIFGAKLIRSAFHENNEVISCDFPDRRLGQGFDQLPKFSTDIAAAWEVMEKFESVNRVERRYYPTHWWCELGADIYSFEAIGDTAPHAICLAALKAVGGLDEAHLHPDG